MSNPVPPGSQVGLRAARTGLPVAAVLTMAGLASAQAPVYSRPAQVRPNQPGGAAEELSAGNGAALRLPPLVREGTFVSAARGQMIRGTSGRWFFVFDPDASGRSLPPMVLMPSTNLTAMERLADSSAPGTRMLVTGMVTAYRDLNYLIPTAPALAVRADPHPEQATDAPSPLREPRVLEEAAPGEPSPADTPARGEPSIEDIVKRLDRAVSRAPSGGTAIPLRAASTPAASPSAVTQPPAPTATPGPTLNIGAIASRRGRIVRAADGTMVFVLDSGSSTLPGAEAGSALAGPTTMTLQPNMALAAIEALSERAGEGATYTVSGDVTVYQDRNYLLVRSYKLNRVTDQILPTQ
ncbi:MAG: hypothetical protein ACK4WH_05755 [Phycisphaerales bacterium]